MRRLLEEFTDQIRLSIGEVSGSLRRIESSLARKLGEIRDALRDALANLKEQPAAIQDQERPQTEEPEPHRPHLVRSIEERRPRLIRSVLTQLEEDD